MRMIQKLEVSFGLATFICALTFFFIVLSIAAPDNIVDRDNRLELVIIRGIIFFIVPALIISVASYLHSVHRNPFGFGLLLTVGGAFALFYSIGFTLAFLVSGNYGVFIGALMGVFAAVTIYFAVQTQRLFSKNNNLP